jgi:Sec-independent protein translocase protein TatA
MSDLVVVLVIVLILVLIWRGPKTLPLLGQALGRGVKEARREASELRASTEPEPETERPSDSTTPPDAPS